MSKIDESALTNENAGPIKTISREDALKICSGQVITTLAVCLKELVENSLDSGATSVTIKFKDQGSTELEVIDNGSGIHSADFEQLTRRHATSKLKSFNDLQTVETFGFRGEALSSLCNVSDVVVVTKDASAQFATRLEFDHQGAIKKQQPTHGNIGTRVYVSNFFSTLPIRRREFLKNIKKEYGKAIDVLFGYCLIYGSVKFECTNQTERNVSTVISTSLNQTVHQRICAIFGTKEADRIIEIIAEPQTSSTCTLQGWVSKGQHGSGRSNKDRQYFFINSRPCDSKYLLKVVNEVYRKYNPHQYPFVVLDVKIDRNLVDVNVTPDKRQIIVNDEKQLKISIENALIEKYSNMQQVFEATLSLPSPKEKSSNYDESFKEPESVSSLIQTQKRKEDTRKRKLDVPTKTSPQITFFKKVRDDDEPPSRIDSAEIESKKVNVKVEHVKEITSKSVKAAVGKNGGLLKNRKLKKYKKVLTGYEREIEPVVNKVIEKQDLTQMGETNDSEQQLKLTKDMFPKMKVIGQFNLGFILTVIDSNLFVIDQHASDEKYNFEDLTNNTIVQTQALVCPQQIQLTVISEQVLMQNLPIFEKNGFKFKISPDAPATQRIKLISRPFSKNIDFNKGDIEELVHLIGTATEIQKIRPSKLRTMFASRACRKSIMIGDPLKISQMRKIVDNLSTLDEPWNCPHGRPTVKYLINLKHVQD